MSEPARARWSQWGGEAVLLVDDADAMPTARDVVTRVLGDFDRACSRFRDDSDLSRVNAAAGRSVSISPLLVEALQAALRAARASEGAVDPTIGEALVLAGYDRDFPLLAAEGVQRRAAVRVRRAAGLEAVSLDVERRTAAVPVGVRLDLGATAKALAADRCAADAQACTGTGVLVSLSGDLAVAGRAPADGWRVRVSEDHRAAADAPGQTISIRDGGLATSSTTVRRWQHGEHERHHIIDPASGSPATVVWRTVSVAAASCLDANTAATAGIVMGARAPDWLRRTGLPARLISRDGAVLALGGWPAADGDSASRAVAV